MAKYFINSSRNIEGYTVLELLKADESWTYGYDHRFENVNDFWLVCGALSTENIYGGGNLLSVTKFSAVFDQHRHDTLLSRAIEYIKEVRVKIFDMVTHEVGDMFSAITSECYVSNQLSQLQELTDLYYDVLFTLEGAMDSSIGRVFLQWISFEIEGDLIRRYMFNERSRTIVFPNLGNCRRIKLPSDVRECHSQSCIVSIVCRFVSQLNAIVCRIDWICLQIAYELRAYERVDITDGPYWMVEDDSTAPVAQLKAHIPIKRGKITAGRSWSMQYSFDFTAIVCMAKCQCSFHLDIVRRMDDSMSAGIGHVAAEIEVLRREIETLTVKRDLIANRPCDLPLSALGDRIHLIRERLEYLEPLVIESQQLTHELECLATIQAQRISMLSEVSELNNRIEQLIRRIVIIETLAKQSGLPISSSDLESS